MTKTKNLKKAEKGGWYLVTIYLDLYFGINFFMDFIILLSVKKIFKITAKKFRIFSGAAIGAIWAVISIVIPESYNSINKFITYIGIVYLMVLVSFGSAGVRENIRRAVCMYIIAFILGGLIHFIYNYTYFGYMINELVIKNDTMIMLLLSAVTLVYILLGQLLKVRERIDNRESVTLTIHDREIIFTGYIDTGNLLEDPIYKKPVNIVEKEKITNSVNEDEICSFDLKYHFVPFNSLGQKDGLLEVIMVDEMVIGNGKNCRHIKKALIGLSNNKLSGDDSYDCLLNSCYQR